jgi:hypothetical protein
MYMCQWCVESVCVYTLVFQVANNNSDDVYVFQYTGDAVSTSSWFLNVRKA